MILQYNKDSEKKSNLSKMQREFLVGGKEYRKSLNTSWSRDLNEVGLLGNTRYRVRVCLYSIRLL